MSADIFAITVKEKTTTLDAATRKGRLVFSVGNTLGRVVKAHARPRPDKQTRPDWLAVAPATQLLQPHGTEVFTVDIAVPPEAAAGTYTLQLEVSDDEAPDDFSSTGPPASFQVPGAIPEKKTPWKWIAVAAAAVLVIGSGAYLLTCHVFGSCGSKGLAFRQACTPGAQPACGDGLKCAPLPAGSFECRREPAAACGTDSDCSSFWCRAGRCSNDDGKCDTDQDCRGDAFTCTAAKVCRKKNGQTCEEAQLCASGFCQNGVCATQPLTCQPPCGPGYQCMVVAGQAPSCRLVLRGPFIFDKQATRLQHW